MLHAHRLVAVRICLLIVGFALLSATSALATSTHRSPAASTSRLHDTSHAGLASEASLQARKSSSSRRTRCVVITTRAGRHRKAGTRCAAKKPKTTGAKPSVQTSANASAPDSAASVGAQTAVMGGALPTEALDVPGSAPGSPADAPTQASVTERQSTATTLSSSLNPSMVGQAVTYTATVSATAATGSVTFADAGTAISGCADRTVSLGATTCTLSAYASASTHSITASYNGAGNYIGSTSSLLSQVVIRASTSTTLRSSANPSMVGQPVIYTATVSRAAATGTVAFEEAGTPIAGCAAQPVGSGTATCLLSGYATAGEHAISATYSGDGNYLTSASSSSKQVVDKTGTTTTTMTLSSSLNPSTVGEAVTYTATVSPVAATGTVEFKQVGVTLGGCATQAVSSGTATCTVANLAVGSPWITAVYSGDSSYAASWSPALTQTVNKKTTTTAVSSSSDPSTVGQAVTYTATVSVAAVTGTVSFDEAGTPIAGCTAQPVSSSTASCTVVDPAAGGYWITAVYSGDSNYAASWSSGFTQAVTKKAATTSVSSSLNPSTVGEALTYTARISAAAATGTVEFKQAGVTISGCAAEAISSSTARCTVANLAAGNNWVTAVYSGDSNYSSSTSSGLTQTVTKKTTTTSASSSLNPSTVGEAVTYEAKVSAAAATGTVEFKQAGVTIAGCAAQPVSSGTATCAVAGPAAGGYGITAAYSGDSSYAASRSSALTQTVNKKTATSSTSSLLNPSTVGQAVTFTATVSPATATGTVEFEQDGVTISKCSAQAVISGTARCTVPNLPVGSPWITAVYSGDSSYAASWSPALTETVSKKPTATTVSSSSDPSTVGQAVTYTATVSPATATGTVEFKEEGAPIIGCTTEIISSGTATCPVMGYPKWSSYRIAAAYNGDDSDLASTSAIFTQTVEPPAGSPTPFRFFSPTSLWNEEVPADAPLDPSSSAVISTFAARVAAEEQADQGPWINTTAYSVPVYTVPAGQPDVRVHLTGTSEPALSDAWKAVPLPPTATPATGADGLLVVWQPSTDRLWEFWRLVHKPEGWSASWGSAMEHVSSSQGAYSTSAWPGAEPWWGASASSLSLVGGLISLEDLKLGQINHALEMAIPDVRSGVYAAPAQRSDGKTADTLSLPEGAHLRLNPNLNLATLHLPRLTLMLAEAAQRYGIFVTDSSATTVFDAQDPTGPEANPYTGAGGYFEGQQPNKLLASFPWNQLELLKMELRSIARNRRRRHEVSRRRRAARRGQPAG
jgi:hypothetical protein